MVLGCPLLHLLSSRAACDGAQKKKKEFFGDYLPPRQGPPHPAGTLRSLHPRFCEFLKQKFGMTHVILDEVGQASLCG
jgi:hypothetical protein